MFRQSIIKITRTIVLGLVMCARQEVTLLSKDSVHTVQYRVFDTLFPS